MKTSLLNCPPLDEIPEELALQCLVLAEPTKDEVAEILHEDLPAGKVLRFLKQLKRGKLLEIGFEHCGCSDMSSYFWVFHPKYNAGLVIWLNDIFGEPRYVDMDECTSSHLGKKLGDLFSDNGFVPLNIEGDRVESPLEGLEVKDLIQALAVGVFAGHARNPDKAAQKWVRTHVQPQPARGK